MKSAVFFIIGVALSLSARISTGAEGKPFLHPLFTDHMVLQRGIDAPVWGWTEPGAKVTVELAHQLAIDRADESGKWMVKLGPFNAGGPHEIKVTGPQTAVIKDVMIGDVWLCSGQSNMQWSVAQSGNPRAEIANANHPGIRLFSVPREVASSPQETVDAAWEVCSPQTVRSFSAVAYYFGRSLHQHLEVPIGLVHSSWGGTIAEAWTSAETLDDLSDFRSAVTQVRTWAQEAESGQDPEQAYIKRLEAWWEENDPGIKGGWEKPATGTADWAATEVPGLWESSGLEAYDGIVWYRHVFTLPAGWNEGEALLELGAIDDADTTWVNGRLIGQTDGHAEPRQYDVPTGTLKEGQNLLAVRVLDTGGNGGFHGAPETFRLQSTDDFQVESLPLAGAWSYRAEAPLSQLKPRPERPNASPNVTTVLYNGMIAPLLPYGIKGAIWYQGESNASRPTQYRTLLPAMIDDWRRRFHVGRFPFLVVQLANFMAVDEQPVESDWAALREAQALTALRDPQAGLAVAIDIGEANDIHPKNKQDVGRRLALAARGIAYEEPITYSGPVYRAMEVDGDAVTLSFDHVGEGLVAKGGGPLKGFAIAGADKEFVWADARIDGERVVVSSPNVSRPMAVRYAWANNPVCNLYNKEGLPAVSFRTDVESAAIPAGYTSLFDGESLNGWRQINGMATYKIVDGTIVGETRKGSPNSFLCTEKHYGDFELQFEVKLYDDALNSGCQIRSNSNPDYQDRRVHGYQVEISTDRMAGFIYDESRRGWLSQDRIDPVKNAAFKSGQWNHYRILCIGDRLKTWVNNVAVANVQDAMTPEGFIGLQVHGVSGDPHWKVAWRNLWIREIPREDRQAAHSRGERKASSAAMSGNSSTIASS